jgi:hypothetical protein
MTIISTDWGDFYAGSERNFLYQQLRKLAVPGSEFVVEGTSDTPKQDPATGHLVGADSHYVTSERVGDRTRFHLHRAQGKVPLLPSAPQVPANEAGVLYADWAQDFANKRENFLRHAVRFVHANPNTNQAQVDGATGELLHVSCYAVHMVDVGGRLRFELRLAEPLAAQADIFE